MRTSCFPEQTSRGFTLASLNENVYDCDTWRVSVIAPQLVALVRAGANFDKGVIIERPSTQDQVQRS